MLIQLLQSLPQFKGKHRVSRLLLGKSIKDKRDVILRGSNHLLYKIPNFIDSIGFDILINGIYEKETSDFIIKKLPKNGILVDIGANIGAVALPVCRQRSDVKSILIEASPRVYRYLEYNTGINKLHNCVLVNNAIAEQDGQKVSFFSPENLFGKGSMSAVFTEEAEEIETVTLDTLLNKQALQSVDFIKIDVEGYEYYAFKGGKNLLQKNNAPDILFEFVDWAESQARDLKPGDAQGLLMNYGYSIYKFNHGIPVGKPLIQPVTAGGQLLYATKKPV